MAEARKRDQSLPRPRGCLAEEKNKEKLREALKEADGDDHAPRLLSRSEYSRRLLQVDRLRFEGALMKNWARNLQELLLKFAADPQFGILFVVDGHEKNYSTPPVPEGFAIDESRRRFHSQEAHRENRHYDYCTMYLGGLIVWRSNNQIHTYPVMLAHPWPGIHQSPKMHAKLALAVARKLPVRPTAIVLDSHYDGLEFRETIRNAGYTCVVRMSVGLANDRHVTLADDSDTTVCTLAANLASNPKIDIKTYVETDIYGKTEETRAKHEIVEVTLGKRGTNARDTATVSLLIRVCFEDGSSSTVNWNRLMVVIMDGALSSRPARFLYQFRFRIEIMYYQLALSETTGREQAINTEHIQFLVSLYLLSTALMVLYVMAAFAEDGFFGRVCVEQTSARAVTEVLLEDL